RIGAFVGAVDPRTGLVAAARLVDGTDRKGAVHADIPQRDRVVRADSGDLIDANRDDVGNIGRAVRAAAAITTGSVELASGLHVHRVDVDGGGSVVLDRLVAGVLEARVSDSDR